MSSWTSPLKWLFRAASWSSRDPALLQIFSGSSTEAGVGVSESRALELSPVWSAVRVISETVSSLPLILYRRAGEARTRATDHSLYRILHDSPNPETTSLPFREAILAHALLWGNGYAEIERDPYGRVINLWLLPPDQVRPARDEMGDLVYEYQPAGGSDLQSVIPARNVFHLRGLGWDGLTGYSVVRMARESLGLTAATERFGARWFGSGSRPSGVLEHPGRLSDDARTRLRTDWERLHSGPTSSQRVAILEEGLKFSPMSVPPEDAQFLATRKFQIEEVARWFNLPPSKLRVSEGGSYASLEQDNLQFLAETLRPWLVRIEQEIASKLLSPIEQSSLYAEHLVEGLLRADQSTRYTAYATARNWGWLSVNEIRARENLDPIEGGDHYLQPLNMQDLETAPTAAPAATPSVMSIEPPEPVISENGQEYASESCCLLAEQMTAHQVQSCEHGAKNRCRICGIQRERVLIPPSKKGDEHSWGIKWVPILPIKPIEDESRAIPQKYEDLDFVPPKGAKEEAARGLEWRRTYGRGGTAVGVARARDISNGVQLSPDTVRRMNSYFARHATDRNGQGWSPGDDGYPSAGRIAWALWGGDPGESWSSQMVDSMDRRDEG
jgi:HK97 family phage portal protein